jgi:hypothetical protein
MNRFCVHIVLLAAVLLLASQVRLYGQTVTTADELRAAMRVTTDAVIVVAGRIALDGRGISTPASDAIISMVGEPGATIDFGSVPPWSATAADGLEFRCRAACLRGITFRNFENKGSALRSNVSEWLHVDGCTLEDIGTRSWPTKTGGLAANANEVWFSNGIGGKGSIIVTGTTFRRVATGDAYAHCIYPTGGGTLTVTGCTFEASGQPVVVPVSRMAVLSGNVYRDNPMVRAAKRGVDEWAYWVAFSSDSGPSAVRFVAIGETFQNTTFQWPIRSYPADGLAHFNHNDYRGVKVAGSWVPWRSTTQPAMTFDDWRAVGFDTGSEAPR